jgi:Putative threonine efflux protein
MESVAILSFFVIMVALAAMPSASVALVVARSASLGVRNGIAVAIGIVVGDLVFVVMALLGMTVLAAAVGSLFSVFKYAGGIYLIWLGVKLLKSKETERVQAHDSRRSTLLASFVSGLLLTLGDMKAILFYASLFPMLIDTSGLVLRDLALIVSVTIIAVGGVKVAYAVSARAIVGRLRTRRTARHTKKIAGGLMIGTGTYIIIKA